jgi:uncharacterized protein
MTGRELAWRVLASEVQSASAEERGSGEKSPSYLISPLGARMNRVLMTGTITPTEAAGPGPGAGFARARLTDPTGVLPVTAGSYQPQGKADLERLTGPAQVLVVGKVTRYRGGSLAPVVSVRAETVLPVADNDYRTLTAEAANQTLARLELVQRLRGPTPPSGSELLQASIPPSWVRGALASVERYPTLDPAPYYEGLRAVLIALRAAPTSEPVVPAPAYATEGPSEVLRVVRPRGVPVAPSPPPGLKALEGRLLEILDELAEQSADGYADMDELAERAARHGLEGERMEELLNYLAENGTLEEPLVGKFRRAEGPPRT